MRHNRYAFWLILLATLPRVMADPVQSVPTLEVDRYLGTWYEIGHLPMFFQRLCASDTTALYSKNTDGTIAVTNTCRHEDRQLDTARGTATVIPNSGNARLKVQFFWPFSGDYWVIGLAPDYHWALVGSPNNKYLWLLSRSPTLAQTDVDTALQIARRQGFDLEKFIYTPHSER
ncbi:lipocalin family protein [Silvimonas amylolytica]|nr:lipocalin family protein [Silvimonas amylolytica]